MSAASRRFRSPNRRPSARSRVSAGALALRPLPSSRSALTRIPGLLFDLDRLPTRVVPAVRTHAMRELGLVALRALRVRGGLRLPIRRTLAAARLALLLLR